MPNLGTKNRPRCWNTKGGRCKGPTVKSSPFAPLSYHKGRWGASGKEKFCLKVPKARKLPSGVWFIQLRLGGESIPVSARTEKECIRQAQLIKAEHLTGKRRKSEKIQDKDATLGEAIDAYIASRSNVISPSTLTGYDKIRRTRFQDEMGRELSLVLPREWVSIVNKEASLVGAKTLKNAWALVRSSVKYYTGEQLPEVPLPQSIPNERPFLDPEQIKIFMGAIHGGKYEIPLLLALSSLRQSEILGLQWGQVDLKRRVIHVKGSVVYSKGGMVAKPENKNRSSTRTVPILMDELYNALKSEQKTTGPVAYYAPTTMRRYILSVCEENGLPPVSIHCLRHSFASLAYHLGVPEKVTMEIGGWSDDHTMKKIYTHIARSDIDRYTAAFGDFFSKNANENANQE